MLVKPTIDELLPQTKNRYSLAMLVAKRARQLISGAQPMVQSETPNMVTLSCEEIAAEEVLPLQGIHEVEVPLRPEVLEARRRKEAQDEDNQRLEIIRDGQILPLDVSELTPEELDMDRFGEAFQKASQQLSQTPAEEEEV